MLVCTYSDLRDHLKDRLDEVNRTREAMLVTRQNAPDAVLLDKEEYDSIMETLHLLRSPGNAERLLRSVAAAEAGQLTPRDPAGT